MKYTLIQKTHSKICDDPICKVIYLYSDESKHQNKYPKYPIYSRVNDEDNKYPPHYLCAICINRKG